MTLCLLLLICFIAGLSLGKEKLEQKLARERREEWESEKRRHIALWTAVREHEDKRERDEQRKRRTKA